MRDFSYFCAMAGVYIHIPFCNSKCAYCGFYSVPSMKQKERFLEALKKEIVKQKNYLNGDDISTVYFGGGTPSLLSVEEIGSLLHLINNTFGFGDNTEITLEANPDTLSLDYLQALRRIGVNRLSIGIQSFFDNDLKYLSRHHDSHHAQKSVAWAKQAGFGNISIDLIYGLPTSDSEQWNRNLDLFFEMDLPHLSAYALTLEPGTILTKQIEQGDVAAVHDEDTLLHYDILCQRAKENNFLHYEISNFCRMGMHSKHNACYWFGTPYLGLGPSAHSYNGTSRQWNASNLGKYVKQAAEPEEAKRNRSIEGHAIEQEQLNPEQQYDEYVMLHLRTHWGIDLKYIKHEMGEHFSAYCEQQAKPLIDQGRLSRTNEFLFLDDKQMLFADGIAAELFWD